LFRLYLCLRFPRPLRVNSMVSDAVRCILRSLMTDCLGTHSTLASCPSSIPSLVRKRSAKTHFGKTSQSISQVMAQCRHLASR